jgi:glucose-1-phosphate adenylyltransferase
MTARRHRESLSDTLALVLAGGGGERLEPLTRDRTKSAVPFGGSYRIIDFTLTNCLHSGLRRICVLPQYKFASLERHLRLGWSPFFTAPGEGLTLLPPQQRVNGEWYRGTADAVYQNLYLLRREAPAYTLILASDQVYRMDYRRLLDFHRRHRADLTIACLEVGLEEASRFGIAEVDPEHQVVGFEEKPLLPRGLPARPGRALASMGLYVFSTATLVQALGREVGDADPCRDFGGDLLPRMMAEGWRVGAYDVQEEEEDEAFYWRDLGTIDAYWEASMDLLSAPPLFALADPDWPLHTWQPDWPPARILQEQGEARVVDSLLGAGAVVAGAQVHRSILSPGVVVGPRAAVVDSVLMDGVQVGAGARLRRAIVDKGVRIPAGYCLDADLNGSRHSYHVSPGGIVVVPRDADLVRESRPFTPPVLTVVDSAST